MYQILHQTHVGGRQTTHLPPPRVPGKAPTPPQPPFSVMHPPPRTEQLAKTYIDKTAIGQLAVPLILDLRDLP